MPLDRPPPTKADLQPHLAEQLVNDLHVAHLGRDAQMQHGFDLDGHLPRLLSIGSEIVFYPIAIEIDIIWAVPAFPAGIAAGRYRRCPRDISLDSSLLASPMPAPYDRLHCWETALIRG